MLRTQKFAKGCTYTNVYFMWHYILPIFSLFERAELDIMCTKPGYFLNISKKIKENFNCIIVADSFEESAPFFANENICIFNCGNYEDYLLPYAKELMSSNAGSTHS